ncbi:Tmem67, partial [Symbiodinium sp. KB8]
QRRQGGSLVVQWRLRWCAVPVPRHFVFAWLAWGASGMSSSRGGQRVRTWRSLAFSAVALAVWHIVMQGASAQSSVEVRTCTQTEAFDTAWLACQLCEDSDPNKEPDPATGAASGGLAAASSCRCKVGYQELSPACTSTDPDVCAATTCSDCVGSGLAASLDRSACMSCPADGPLDVSARECVCATAGMVLRDDGPVGSGGVRAKRCATCPAGQRAFFPAGAGAFAASAYDCRACPDPTMELSASGECSCPSGSTRVAGVEGVGADYCVPTDGLAALTTLGVAPSDASSVVFRAVELPAAASAAAATNDAPASITLSTGVVVSNPLAGLAAVSGVTSLPVRYHYPRAATGCLSWRGQASSPRCHALANLCVLALLDPAAAPCILFRLMAASREGARAGWQGWTRSLPLLQYADPAAALGSTALTQEMSFDDTVRAASEDTIRVVLASFALNGTFLGLVPMKRQLAYCGSAAPAAVALSGSTSSRTGVSDFDDPEWTRFGYGITMAVGCNLAGLLRDGSDVNSTVFYEPYFVDVASSLALSKATTDGSGLSGTSAPLSADPPLALYPMPVRIVNYRAADGGTPNADAYSPGAETGDDVLSRRFFLYDRVSGLSTASAAGTPQILRYARRLVLSMRAQDTSRAKLLVPVLTVEYRERRADDVVADTDGLGRDEVEFRVLYEAEQSQYWTAAVVMFAIGQTLAVGFAVLRMFNWNRRSVRTTEEGGLSLIVLGRFLVYLAHGYAHAAFWVAVVLCAYWFAFFKLQARVFALLPEDEPALTQDDYETLAVVLCTALAGQLLRGGELMYEQCTVDVFFVDWEKPRGELASASATVDSDR